MKYSALIFDMDGLLIDSERLAFEISRELIADRGGVLTLSDYQAFIGLDIDASSKLYRSKYGITTDDYYRDFNILYNKALENGRLAVRPGAVELLEFAKGAGLNRAVGSSNLKSCIDVSLEATGLDGYFDLIVCSEDVGRGKPAPDVFIEVARRLETDRGSCLVLEDSEVGIKAAVAAGIDAVLIPDFCEVPKSLYDNCVGVFPSLSDVIPFIKNSRPE